jgi:hypothetical protein
MGVLELSHVSVDTIIVLSYIKSDVRVLTSYISNHISFRHLASGPYLVASPVLSRESHGPSQSPGCVVSESGLQ